MANLINLPFNSKSSRLVHLDINSCFATIEQQANPLYRGKPLAVAAYNRPTCCVLAPSIEAKNLGIKTGNMVFEARRLCPSIVILEPDPDKYRYVHDQLFKLLQNYSDIVIPKSIDEFILDFTNFHSPDLFSLARKMKADLKNQIGDYITVSIGIGPSRFLAKTAAGLVKPDGLNEINQNNYLEVYKNLTLIDLNGINVRNQYRLNSVGINTVLDFYHAPYAKIFEAFRSVNAQDWFLRLRGYEADDREFSRRSFGHSYVIPKPLAKENTLPIIQKLTHKATTRLRQNGYKTAAVSLALFYQDKTFWHQDHRLPVPLFSSNKIFREIYSLFSKAPNRPVKSVALSCHRLVTGRDFQLSLFEDTRKEFDLTQATDRVNQSWGIYTLTPASMLPAKEDVPDRIAFGR